MSFVQVWRFSCDVDRGTPTACGNVEEIEEVAKMPEGWRLVGGLMVCDRHEVTITTKAAAS